MRFLKRIKLIFVLLLLGHLTLAETIKRDSTKLRLKAWNEDKIIVSLGWGFPNYPELELKSYKSLSTTTITSVSGYGPFHGKLEYALGNHFGFGVSVNYSSVSFTRLDSAYNPSYYQLPINMSFYKSTFFSLNARLNYHFFPEKIIDPYIGIGLGFKQIKIKYQSVNNYNTNGTGYVENQGLPFGFELTTGLRFFVTKRIGAYIECGISRSLVQGGLSFNLGRN